MNNCPVGIFWIDKTGAIISVNQKWIELTGLDRNEAINRIWTDDLDDEEKSQMTNWFSFAKNAKSFESTFKTKKDKFVAVQIILDVDSDNSNPVYIGTLTDITFQKASEKTKIDQINQTWEATLALQQSDQKMQFEIQQLCVNRNAYDCSTAISVCLDQLETISNLLQDNEKEISKNKMKSICEEMDGHLALIKACATSQRVTVERLLNDLNEPVPKKTDFVLEDLIKVLEHMFQRQIKRKNIDVVYHYSKEKSILRGDPSALLHIFIALFSNALKFTSKDPKIEVFLDCQISIERPDHEKRITFTVKDNGIGMPQDTIYHLFSNYCSAPDPRRYPIGRLRLAKAAADYLHGRIGVESEIGRGSTVTFCVDMEYSRTIRAPEDRTVIVDNKPNYNILVAEDNLVNQKILARVLTGCNVVFANNGQEAVNIFNAEDGIDLILMDIQMPVMDGIEATGIIRDLEKIDNRKPIPIIATLAYPLKGESERKEYEQFTLCIEKPLSREKVMKKIHDLITKYREECKNKI
eukprot:TRINITY_DN9934_c0_g1_i2.p1 TRINITY_DN9934_c0_g1~~TRINITY_DN9934_c0_g1_i2.p1  ORF type:complete len:561 (-),score=102.76 TRINITY_DN9934_c0_g1_i2:17-1588(-)